jgi:hypothetical protein
MEKSFEWKVYQGGCWKYRIIGNGETRTSIEPAVVSRATQNAVSTIRKSLTTNGGTDAKHGLEIIQTRINTFHAGGERWPGF